jgi:ankyrin repeat protein
LNTFFPTFLEFENPVISVSSLGGEDTLLHVAAQYGHENIIRFYQEELNYLDVNPLSSDGRYTPMMWAAQEGKLNVVKYYIGAVQGD